MYALSNKGCRGNVSVFTINKMVWFSSEGNGDLNERKLRISWWSHFLPIGGTGFNPR